MTISELIEEIGQTKDLSNKTYSLYKAYKDKEDLLKEELSAKLEEAGLKSAKGKDYSASITSKSEVVITNEQDVIEWLRNEPDIEVDQYIGLKLIPLKGLVNYRLKEHGEIVPGSDRVIKDSLAIKRNGG